MKGKIGMKAFIKRQFSNFFFFYDYLRYKVFIAVAINIGIGVLDGFGLAMFLPLLQLVGNSESVKPEEMGNLRFLIEAINKTGISLTLTTVLISMLLFFSLKGILTYCGKVYNVLIQQYFIRTIRLELLNLFNSIRFENYILADIGRIQNTMSGEVERIARAYNSYFLAFQLLVLAIVYMGFAFFIDPLFALMVTIFGGLVNILFKIIYKYTKKASLQLTVDANIYQGKIIQHVSNFKYLKATGRVQTFSSKLANTIDLIEVSRKKMGYLGAIAISIREPLLILVFSVVLIIQTNFLGAPLGPILISLLFFYRALSSVMSMQTAWNYFLENSGSLQNMKAFQNELKNYKSDNGNIIFNGLKRKLSLKEVEFTFYGRKKVLRKISLDIFKSQTIAFVGESGSGKTTIINLISGLFKPNSGSYMVDDIPIEKFKIETFQKRIGYITQEPVIFNDTIYNNISLWEENSKKTQERFEMAIQKASIADFISSLPEGKGTILGNNGINLSGGQKQRISIARELFKDIDILIMDEATSALDSETEKAIQENIDNLKGQYTIIIVAHRLSTIRNVDKVVYINNGRIIESGTFEDLMKSVPQFKKMVDLQEL